MSKTTWALLIVGGVVAGAVLLRKPAPAAATPPPQQPSKGANAFDVLNTVIGGAVKVYGSSRSPKPTTPSQAAGSSSVLTGGSSSVWQEGYDSNGNWTVGWSDA